MGETTGPSPARSVCTWVWSTANGAVTFTRGAFVSVDPVTATLPVLPANVQSGVPPFCGAAVGQEPAAVAVRAPSRVRTVAATAAANATEAYIREDFTAVTLQPFIASMPVGTHRLPSRLLGATPEARARSADRHIGIA